MGEEGETLEEEADISGGLKVAEKGKLDLEPVGTFQKKRNTNRALVQGIVSGLIILKRWYSYAR